MQVKVLAIIVGVLAVAALILAVRAGFAQRPPATIRSWLCYYGMAAEPETFNRFDLVVFDGTYHPVLPEKAGGRPLVLGYASVGEVVDQGHLWEQVRNRTFLLKKKPVWNSWIVDVTDPDWQALVLETVIPAIADRGFDGFFLDNLDTALGLPESAGRPEFIERRSALLKLVRGIREAYPDRRIAVNRGLPILAELAPIIDFVVVEGLYSTYSHSLGTYGKTEPYAQNLLLQQLQQGLRARPALQVLTVDYAAPLQTALIADAIAFSRNRGFIPYVGTYTLDQIFVHTLDR